MILTIGDITFIIELIGTSFKIGAFDELGIIYCKPIYYSVSYHKYKGLTRYCKSKIDQDIIDENFYIRIYSIIEKNMSNVNISICTNKKIKFTIKISERYNVIINLYPQNVDMPILDKIINSMKQEFVPDMLGKIYTTYTKHTQYESYIFDIDNIHVSNQYIDYLNYLINMEDNFLILIYKSLDDKIALSRIISHSENPQEQLFNKLYDSINKNKNMSLVFPMAIHTNLIFIHENYFEFFKWLIYNTLE